MSLPHDALPEASVLEQAFKCEIEDASGAKIQFGSLFAEQKTVVVFVRQFFCGQYVSQLATVPEAALEAASTKLVVIGCGDYRVLEHYKDLTEFHGSIYADSSLQLYQLFGMISNLAVTPSDQEKPSYITRSRLAGAWVGWKNGPMKAPSLMGKQGPIRQLGGDFVFGPGNQCTFAHRMRHTEDHIEVADLMKTAGVIL
ncbi:AhpC/TSA antioxidant enzyme-domain-containing protein [Mycena metata]|uniref:AhpC/TSA antioxidant enzyme-domain-containing protein n=1 Tax=Mycena metata TaxID=1033252 RepID=A0AAD7MEZ6_9AGAR|nr:AhpC/TSA antioxidant enzyme-domain-containing protein [Mycena metata]